MPVLSAWVWVNGLHPGPFHPQLRARLRGGRLGFRRTPPSPRHQSASHGQQRSRILGRHLEGRYGPRRHDVVDSPSGSSRLGPVMYDLDIRQAARRDGTLEERALSRCALQQDEGDPRQRDGQGHAGQPRTGAQVKDALRGANLGEIQGDQRVGQVIVEGGNRVADRRRSERIMRQQAEKAAQLLNGGARRKAVPGDQPLESSFDPSRRTRRATRVHPQADRAVLSAPVRCRPRTDGTCDPADRPRGRRCLR